MPLDPRIPLGIQAPQGPNPLEIMQTVAQLQGVREQTEARRLAAEEARARRTTQAQADAAYQAAVKVHPETGAVSLDYNVLLAHLPPALIPAVKKEYDADLQRFETLRQTRAATRKADQEFLGSQAQTVITAKGDPIVWGVALRAARDAEAIDAETFTRLDALTDPQQILAVAQGYVQQAGGKPPEGFTLGRGQIRFGPSGEKIAEGLAPEPPTPAYQQKDVLLDGKPAIVTFDAHSGKSFLGQEDVTARVRPIPPQGPGPERIVSIMGPDGKPVYVRESAAVGQTPGTGTAGRVATEGERKAAGFHTQMQQALTTINDLESKLTDRDLYQIQSLPQEGITGAINRGVMSDTAKQYIQAFNQFTEARLRPVSGAAIAASEYERDRATYGKQYAETKALATQRQAARKSALEALRVMGGAAIEETAGPRTGEAPPPGGGSVPGLTYQDYLRSKGGR